VVGIVLPAAGPVGEYTTAQVESAYVMTRKLLAAAFLDQKTLLGGQSTAFADLLTSQQETWFLDGLDKKGVDQQGTAPPGHIRPPAVPRSIPTRWGTPRALRHCSAGPQRAPDDWDMGLAGYS
jgi:hypothetical protein